LGATAAAQLILKFKKYTTSVKENKNETVKRIQLSSQNTCITE